MSFTTFLKTFFIKLMLFLDVWLLRKKIQAIEDLAATEDTLQSTLADVESANSIPELIDNLNKLKQNTKH